MKVKMKNWFDRITRKQKEESIGINKVSYPDNKPICPHCDTELDSINVIEDFGQEDHNVYFCPHCKKVLGMGYDFAR